MSLNFSKEARDVFGESLALKLARPTRDWLMDPEVQPPIEPFLFACKHPNIMKPYLRSNDMHAIHATAQTVFNSVTIAFQREKLVRP